MAKSIILFAKIIAISLLNILGIYERIQNMGEKRHPAKVILVRGDRLPGRKIEIFSGDLFSGKTFYNLLGESVTEGRQHLFRLRINGKWFPARRKILYTSEDVNHLLIEIIGE
jgi:hypothetical protein